jgi:hypothetical protein
VGWPAGSDPHQLMAHYYDTVADGVVNDRWTQVRAPGNPIVRALYLRYVILALKATARLGRELPRPRPDFHYDVETHEYAVPDPAPTGSWELCRGLGRSFGYDARETTADTLTGTQLVHLLVDVVANGGNLLINVGPDGSAAGSIATARPSTPPAGGLPPRPPPPLATRSGSPTGRAPSAPSSRPTSSPTTSPSGAGRFPQAAGSASSVGPGPCLDPGRRRRADYATHAATWPACTGPEDHHLLTLSGRLPHGLPSDGRKD